MCLSDVPVTESETQYACCETPYTRLTFNVRLRRKPFYYIINLLVPSVIFSVLTIVALTLQPGCSERIGLGAFTYLFICNVDRFILANLLKSELRYCNPFLERQRDIVIYACYRHFLTVGATVFSVCFMIYMYYV